MVPHLIVHCAEEYSQASFYTSHLLLCHPTWFCVPGIFANTAHVVSAAWPPPVRKASGFPAACRSTCGSAAFEAQPLSLKPVARKARGIPHGRRPSRGQLPQSRTDIARLLL